MREKYCALRTQWDFHAPVAFEFVREDEFAAKAANVAQSVRVFPNRVTR